MGHRARVFQINHSAKESKTKAFAHLSRLSIGNCLKVQILEPIKLGFLSLDGSQLPFPVLKKDATESWIQATSKLSVFQFVIDSRRRKTLWKFAREVTCHQWKDRWTAMKRDENHSSKTFYLRRSSQCAQSARLI